MELSKEQIREFMKQAVDVMKLSIQEPRKDKVSPAVGAVLVLSDGSVQTAHRGELRHGDHAEFTLLERKNRDKKLDDSILFATLEPCAPGSRNHPKLGCAERIVNARIKTVYIGIEDPDPTVDRKGIKYLQESGIEVHIFDKDLQDDIRTFNADFLKGAEERAKEIKSKQKIDSHLSKIELSPGNTSFDNLDKKQIIDFIKKANLNVSFDSTEFSQIGLQLGIFIKENGNIVPSGIGLLLFGQKPQLSYPNALIRASYISEIRNDEDMPTFEGSLPVQTKDVYEWFEKIIGKSIDRSRPERETVFNYPGVVFREAILNAIVHRDYDITGSPVLLEINDDAIVIKSPGLPVSPISIEQMKSFSAPVLSRNPKIVYVFDQLKLVEQRGKGFKSMKELSEKFKLPLPIIYFEDPYLVLVFPRHEKALTKYSRIEGLDKLNADELKGYNWLREQAYISSKEYADTFNLSTRQASRHLNKMLNLGLLLTNIEPVNSPKYRYIVNRN